MRTDPAGSQLVSPKREPRIAVGVIYPTGSIYVTNRGAWSRYYLRNANFETGDLTGWVDGGGGQSIGTTGGGHDGSTYYIIVPNAAGGPNAQSTMDTSPPVGTTVRLSGWARRDESSLPATDQTIGARFYDVALAQIGTRLIAATASNAVSGWQYVEGTVTVPATAVWMRTDLGEGSTSGQFHWDDISAEYLSGEIENVPGNVVHGALEDISSIGRDLSPLQARSTIAAFDFSVVDVDGELTDELRAQLGDGEGVGRREVRLYTGDTDDFTDGSWSLVDTFVVDSVVKYDRGSYRFQCSDRQRELRDKLFPKVSTRLTADFSESDTSITVADTDDFDLVPHTASFSDAPSSTVLYFRVKKTGEIVRATGKTSTSFTGLTRERFNTIAQAVDIDPAADVDRQPEIELIYYLEMPAPQLTYALLTGDILENLILNGGGEIGTVGSQATSWILSAGNDLAVASDFVVHGQRSLKITNAGVADSASRQDFAVVGGETYLLEGWIKTSALPTADAGYGAVLNVDIVSGVASYTIVEKNGDDPSATFPDVGVAATGAAVNWRYVSCEFIPNASGTLRLYCQLGYGGGQSGTAWFDSVRVRRIGQLPEGYHLGIDRSLVEENSFIDIGADLYDPDDATAGLVLSFGTHRGLRETDGKRFIEEQLLFPMWAFLQISNEGKFRLRRLVRLLSDASPVATADTDTVMSHGSLDHQLGEVANRVIINWNHDGDRFTRQSEFVNLTSISAHGEGRTLDFDLFGVTVARHTRETLRRIFDSMTDRFGAPPQTIDLELSSTLNQLEDGDVLRVTLPGVRDYAAADSLDRAFEVQQKSWNPRTGEVRVQGFGSTSRMEPDEREAAAAPPLSDAWYSSEGVALSTVLTIVANAITVNGDLAGNIDLRDGVYYHLGDLTLNAGITVTVNQNTQLRVRGDFTVNGRIDGVGRGLDAIPEISVVGVAPAFVPIDTQTVGTTHSSGGMNYFPSFAQYRPTAGRYNIGAAALARPALGVVSGALVNMPSELRGTPGIPGALIVEWTTGAITRGTGAAGGNSGAGLAIVCRGTLSFGVSGEIDLSGGDGSAPGATVSLGGHTLYPGAGAGGAPGGLLVVLDGNDIPLPDLTDSFVALLGSTPQTGNPIEDPLGIDLPADPMTGFDPGASQVDMWQSSFITMWVPAEIDTGDGDDETVPAPTSLAVVTTSVGVMLTWASPPPDRYDFVEVWRATTNDRTGAVRVFRGKADSFFDQSPQQVTRYYWIRAARVGTAVSAWYPTGSTSGQTATYGGVSSEWNAVLVDVTRSGQTFTKTGGVDGAFDASFYSVEGYRQAYLGFTAVATNKGVAVGFDSTPSSSNNRDTIEEAFSLENSAVYYIFVSGTSVIGPTAYAAGDRFEIVRDLSTTRWYVNGVLIHTIATAGTIRYIDSSFLHTGASIEGVVFGPIGGVGTGQIDPEAATEILTAIDDTFTDALSGIGAKVITIDPGVRSYDYVAIVTASYRVWITGTNTTSASTYLIYSTPTPADVTLDGTFTNTISTDNASPGRRVTLSGQVEVPANSDWDFSLQTIKLSGDAQHEIRDLNFQLEIIKR